MKIRFIEPAFQILKLFERFVVGSVQLLSSHELLHQRLQMTSVPEEDQSHKISPF